MNMLNEPGLMASEMISPSSLLTDNLPLLAGAPNGIQKLRELILELAVRGKLVPQDQNDEPASELLKHIAEEKSRLVAEGIIRKQKPLLERQKEDKPFELPTGWEWSRLGEIALINPRNSAPDSTKVSFVPMTLIGTRFDGRHAQEVRTWAEVKQGFTHFAEGDIGVAKITPCFENSKACVFSDLENSLGAGTTELHIVRPVGKYLAARYVLAYLKSPQFLLVGETKMTGTAGQKRLPKDFVESNPFPLPPLAEQYRIVAKVDELMALCDRLEAQQASAENAHARLVQALLDSLTQASDADDFAASWQRLAEHFHTLFTTESSIDALKKTFLRLAADGRLVSSDMPADYLPLSDVIEGDSLNGSSKKPQDSPGTVEILRISAGTGVADFLTDEYEHKWADVTEAEIQKFLLTKDDLLACRFNGNLHYVGAFSLYCGNRGVAQIFPDKLIRFRADRNKALPHYLKYILNAAPARTQIESFCAITVGNIGISAKNLKTIKIRLPSLEEQSNIVGLLDHLMTLCEQLKTRLTQARQLNEQLAIALVEQAVA